MSISEPFIKRPVATALLMVGVVLLGLLGYSLLPISALPPVDFPTIQVVAQYPGASPDVMVSSVTTPLERQFGEISGLNQMTSVSAFGTTTITLQFTLDRNIDAAAQDVQAAVNAANGVLPHNMPNPPTYNKVNPADTPILTLRVTSDTLPLEKVNDLADTVLAQKLSEVTGVGLVTIEGNQKPAVRVQINPGAIASLGLSLEDVRNALTLNNINQPKGSFDGHKQSYSIGANDQIFSAPEYRNVIIAYKNGSPIRLRDVGDVIDDVENVRLAGWVDDKPAVIVDIQRQPGANIIQTADRVKALLPRLKTSIPPSVNVGIFSDRTEMIRASIKDVQFTLVLTVVLVVMVIFLFLRKFWATVIPSVALPLAIIGTFGVMDLAGFSLDNLSLMALTIATGFVVDDAIVMIENIVRFIEAGDPPMEAALKGAKQIGFTIISLSLSLIGVFIPLIFMTGIVGRLFREFAITMSIAVVVSAVVSLTLTPMMCARLLRPENEDKHGWFYRWTEGFFQWMLGAYDHGLRWVLRHQFFTLMVAVATLVATVWLYIIVPKGLLPLQDTGLIIGVTDASQTISFKGMVEKQRSVAEEVRKDPDVVSVASFVGAGTVNATPNTGRLYINLKPKGQRSASIDKIIARLRQRTESLEGVSLFMQAVQDVQIDSRVSRTQYQYTLQDADEGELNEWAPRLLQALRAHDELVDVASDQQSGGLALSVDINRDKASQFNVLPQNIDDTLYDAFGQRQVTIIFTQLNQYRVILEASPNFQLTPAALDQIYVKSTTGRMIPLSAFASVKTTLTPLVILHEGQFPAVTLSFNLGPDSSLGAAVTAIQEAERQINLPETVATSFSGSAAEFRSSLKSEPFLILAAIVVIYIILGVLYESYIHPITILSSLPSAGVGALLAMMLFHIELSLVALIGIILLIGIVKKNAIMMIDFALDAEREQGLPPEESIYQACRLRFRPIMMTTMAALLGAMPLALQNGNGSELRQPLGISIVGGLLVSQFLTLYTTPVIYLYLDRLSAWAKRSRRATGPAEAPAGAAPVPVK
ncbi:MAG TPA: multidrug efflux RND transporter permease subunit [Verrucomicrobiae bacterium]|jgi:hydrophobe/amphiphile efflux-1 (HAE1) family protein|nr:multidrug efflux RND transporter permease subunit [Verrucomicrobiae bacterium]